MRIGMIMKADRSTTGKDEEGKRDEEGISGSDDLIRLCETLRLRALWTSRGFPKIGAKGVKIHSLHVRQEGSSALISHLIAIPITTHDLKNWKLRELRDIATGELLQPTNHQFSQI